MYVRTCMHACICTLHLRMYLHAYVDKRIFVVDLDNMEAILKEYDDNLIHKATPDNILGLIDASSLLWRLEVINVTRHEKIGLMCTQNLASFLDFKLE